MARIAINDGRGDADPPVCSNSNQVKGLHRLSHMAKPKCTVYVIKSVCDPSRYYTGVTSDVRDRLEDHNAGRCPSTVDSRPWKIDVFIQFADEARALNFERYLKSGSGCAFARRHLR